jgi:cell division protein FtsI (penicillin-binding protein 3)
MSLIERRIGLLFALFVLAFVVAIGRAAWLQAVEGSGLSADAQSQQTETVEIPSQRGTILDRNGRKLAVSEEAATIFATPYQVKHPTDEAQKLASILGLDPDVVLQSIADRQSGFAYIDRKVDLETANRIEKLDLPGIGTLPDSRRTYPQGTLASQVIGSVGTENQGLTGLEAADDTTLRGTTGEREIVNDALGQELQRKTLTPASPGTDMQLTIDAGLQAETERVLSNLATTFQPKGATAIVMDPRNSQVLAMANYPSYDPSDPADASPQELANRATGYTYEPGSTFKAFTVAGALQDGVVTPSTTFDLPTIYQVADRKIEDAEPRGPVTLSVAQILAQSSNVGAVKIGQALNAAKGPDRFDHWVRRFGFGEPTGIDFPGEEQGLVLHADEYSGSTMGNLPMGQGLSVTPIQMATAYSAIADGGILHQPSLVLRENGEPITEPQGRRVITSSTAAQVRKMLEGVLQPGGTASEVSVPGYTLAGKTGTAQKVVDGKYSDTQFVASFVGFAPADNPQILVSIMVDEPSQGSYYGGAVAAPAFGEIAKFAFQYLGIPPDDPQ